MGASELVHSLLEILVTSSGLITFLAFKRDEREVLNPFKSALLALDQNLGRTLYHQVLVLEGNTAECLRSGTSAAVLLAKSLSAIGSWRDSKNQIYEGFLINPTIIAI
jgi:hypothetical protein